MKKISYLELSSLIFSIILAFNSGINIYLLKNEASIDSWLSIIISYIIGFIPILLILYISSYQEDLTIYEKNITLFGRTLGKIINLIILTVLFIISITLLYNIVFFITTQFLYHTPMIITSILLVAVIVYSSIKGINVISHVSLILTFINILFFLTNSFSLISEIKLDNLLPFLKTPIPSIISSSLKITVINILPLLSILIIPKNSITNKKFYNKTIILSYTIAFIITFLLITGTFSILGVYLTKTYEYSEYIVLKKVKLFGFLERIENIASTCFITETYIYITLIFYSISKSITNNKKSFIYTNIFLGILIIILNIYLFNNITTFNNYIKTTFIYIVSSLLIIYFLISLKLLINKTKNEV